MNKKRIVAIFLSIFMLVTVIWAFSEHFVAASSGWNEVIRLTSDDSSSEGPIMAVNGNNIHVVWQDDRDGNYEIYYKRSIDNGETWGSDTKLTTDDSGSWVPVVAVNGNNIHVVWQDSRDGNYEIYYKRSIDNGETWGSDTKLTTDDLDSSNPVMAVNGNNIHVVWQDDRDGNYEIYYKRYYRQTPNQKPTADTLGFSENYVYKGDSITLYANASDDFDNEYDLTPTFEYKFSLDGIWQNTDISYITWDSERWCWKATFSPSNEIEIGMYDFRVKFTDSDSEESDWMNGSEQIDVRARPIAVLSASTTNIIIGESITFNASMSTGEELLFYFDFGDGTTVDWGYDAVKTHKYSEEGTYSAQVKVKDVYGKESLWGNIEIAVRSSKSDEDSGIPSFEIFLVLCAIALVLLWKRKRMQ